MSSSTSPPITIRLRSRSERSAVLDAGLGDRRWPGSEGTALVDDPWARVDKLETLPYNDADGAVSATPPPGPSATEGGVTGRIQPTDAVVPSVRLDESVDTQSLTSTAFELPAEAFSPIKPPSPLEAFTARAFDIAVAMTALAILSPVMLLVALAVFIDSGRPIFYGSGRIGHRRPTFRAWKFRSMRPDADQSLERLLLADDEARREYETYHKLHQDPRLTRVGGFIRRTSLDELPQLWNVVRGEMSIVGPRPKLPVDAACYGPALDTVLSIRPGLTGLWQVSGRNDVSMRDRVILDVRYVHTRTLRGDLWIIVRTFAILCRPGRHGAY